MSPLETLRRLLDTGAEPSYADLTERLDLSERQVRRLLDGLRAQGVPVRHRYDGSTKRFFLPEEAQQHTLSGLAFDADEVRALAIAASASRAALARTPFAPHIERAFGKLLEHTAPVTLVFEVDAAQHAWHFEEAHFGDIEASTFETITKALEERREVVMDYDAASTKELTENRCVRPYCLVRRGRALMLVAWCCLRGEKRNFALEGIQRISITERYFSLPDDFDPALEFRDAMGAVNSGEVEVVRLLAEPDRAPYFRRRNYMVNQQIEEERADGRIVVSFESQGVDTEVLSFVLSWGAGVTVLEPASLAGRVREEAMRMAARYE